MDLLLTYLSEACSTHATLVRFFTCVYTLVLLQVRRVIKAFLTKGTLVRKLPRVHADVFFHVAGIRDTLVANRAGDAALVDIRLRRPPCR